MNTGNKKVGLFKRVTIDGTQKWCAVVQASNGRIKPDYVIYAGQEVHVPGGAYYISYREGDRLIRRSVGENAQEAERERKRQELMLIARATGMELGVGVQQPANGSGSNGANGSGKRKLRAAVEEYLAEIEATKKPKTYVAYKTALDYFLESCKKTHLEDVERKDLLAYSTFLRDKQGHAPRTVNVKFGYLMVFLKHQGITGLAKKNDWPTFTLEEPEVYEQAQLDKFFAACEDDERMIFEFFQMTGMREQEVIYAVWKNVDFAHNTVSVRYLRKGELPHDPHFSWSPKAYKERTIPVPAKLIERLKVWKEKAKPGCPLIFPTSGCRPKMDFLHVLKGIVRRAEGLDEKDFWLHKFRATFCTWSLWAGVDLRTVQMWAGHEDIESTMRYLKPNRSQEVQSKVNQIFGGMGR